MSPLVEASPVALVEQALGLARSRSLRRDRIDWEERPVAGDQKHRLPRGIKCEKYSNRIDERPT